LENIHLENRVEDWIITLRWILVKQVVRMGGGRKEVRIRGDYKWCDYINLLVRTAQIICNHPLYFPLAGFGISEFETSGPAKRKLV